MKAEVWRRAVTAHVVPRLPGTWLATGYALVQAPITHLASAVVRVPSSYGTSYRLQVVVQPLYVELEGWQGRSLRQLGRGRGQGHWPGFDTVNEGAESMGRLAVLVESDALPLFAEHGTLAGFRRLCQNAAAEHPSFGKVYPLREQAATEVLLGENTAAVATLDEIQAIADATDEAPSWLHQIAAEADSFREAVAADPTAAADTLAAVEERMRTTLRL